jgi:hypothetical protein
MTCTSRPALFPRSPVRFVSIVQFACRSHQWSAGYARMINVLDREVEFVLVALLVPLRVAAILAAAIG